MLVIKHEWTLTSWLVQDRCPPEVLQHIFRLLEFEDVSSFRGVARRYANVGIEYLTWRIRFFCSLESINRARELANHSTIRERITTLELEGPLLTDSAPNSRLCTRRSLTLISSRLRSCSITPRPFRSCSLSYETDTTFSQLYTKRPPCLRTRICSIRSKSSPRLSGLPRTISWATRTNPKSYLRRNRERHCFSIAKDQEHISCHNGSKLPLYVLETI